MHYAFERRHGNDAPEDELRAASAAYVDELAAKGTPYVFAGLPGALCGAYDDVVLFGPGSDHDWELELAVVIGRTAWRVARRGRAGRTSPATRSPTTSAPATSWTARTSR